MPRERRPSPSASLLTRNASTEETKPRGKASGDTSSARRRLPPLPPQSKPGTQQRAVAGGSQPSSPASSKNGRSKPVQKKRTLARDGSSDKEEGKRDSESVSASNSVASAASKAASKSALKANSQAGVSRKGGGATEVLPLRSRDSGLGRCVEANGAKCSDGPERDRTDLCRSLEAPASPRPRSMRGLPSSRPHLLLPAVLGDPIFSVDLDACVGVVAGSLLGRVSAHLFDREGWPPAGKREDAGGVPPSSPGDSTSLSLLFASPSKARRASFSRQRAKTFLAALPGAEAVGRVKTTVARMKRAASSAVRNTLYPTAVTHPPPLHPHCYCGEADSEGEKKLAWAKRGGRGDAETHGGQGKRDHPEEQGELETNGNGDAHEKGGERNLHDDGERPAAKREAGSGAPRQHATTRDTVEGEESEETGREEREVERRESRDTRKKVESDECLETKRQRKVGARTRGWHGSHLLAAPLLPLRVFRARKNRGTDKDTCHMCTSLKGLFVLFAAYGDDACSSVSISPSCVYSIFGMSEIVRWESISLKCLGGERVSPSQFAPHRSAHSTTTFFVSRHPIRSSRRALTERGRNFAGGGGVGLVISLGCDAYDDLQKFFCIPLWRSLEANSMVVVDCDGIFLLCVMSDCISGSRYFYLVDMRGSCSREFKENYSWSTTRKSFMHKFVAYRREAPKHFSLAKIFRNSFLLVCEGSHANRIVVYDASAAIVQHTEERKRQAMEMRRRRQEGPAEAETLEDLPWNEDALCDLEGDCGLWEVESFERSKAPTVPLDRATPVHTFVGHLTTIVALDANREDDLIFSLGSDAKLFLWRWRFTAPLMVFDCSPATFNLGWPWVLVSDEDIVAFSCDHGVYAMPLARHSQRRLLVPLSRPGKKSCSNGEDLKRETGTMSPSGRQQ